MLGESNQGVICAFSSNSRELYKADIYRALVLPRGSIIQFRYRAEYVEDALRNSLHNLVNQSAAIVYRFIPPYLTTFKIKDIPIRSAKIEKIYQSKETQIIHVFMSVENFCEFSLESKSEKLMESKIFLGKVMIDEVRSSQWLDRVRAIEPFFPRIPFITLEGIYQQAPTAFHFVNNRLQNLFRKQKLYAGQIQVKQAACRTHSYLALRQGDMYQMKLAYYVDLRKEKYSIDVLVASSHEDAVIISQNRLSSTISYEDLNIPVYVNSTRPHEEMSFVDIKFDVPQDHPLYHYSVRTLLLLPEGWLRSFYFSIFSLGLIVGGTVLTVKSEIDIKPLWLDLSFRAVGIVLVTLGFFALFRYYRKV